MDTELYELTIYVGYVAAGFLIAEFLFLIIFQEAVRHFESRKHPRGRSLLQSGACLPGTSSPPCSLLPHTSAC